MTSTTVEHLLRNMIGFDPLLNRFGAPQTNYPPHNIEKLDDDRYRLTLAIAGFREADLNVTLLQGILTIVGSRSEGESDDNYLYRGIALRDFRREFRLGENVEVANASLEHGLLVIDLIRNIPEAERPKVIPIRA